MSKKLENITKIKTKSKTSTPKFYKVFLLNDDFTTMDFVVRILMMFFNKNYSDAYDLMMKIHQTGSALCGVYPKDTALTIQNKIHSYAFKFGYPLKCKIEE